MPIGPGSHIGPYEVTSLLGEGGMGRVWRAHHAALRRDDALKVLSDAVAADPERLARFQREAQVLASLSHPNIAHIYGLEATSEGPALVMELVEGPTLADRLAEGAMPVDEALPVARQIADALDAAHEQGIVHRDLKPANIKWHRDGTVKVLDFGLAKALPPKDPAAANLTQSPTLTSPAITLAGIVLGTAAYMSPEQARGQPADKRGDIWAFGCVLYEMLTGRRAFAGDGITDTMAAVLRAEPDWAALPAQLPSPISRLLRRCLDKDPKRRLRDVGDARLELDEALRAGVSEPAAVAGHHVASGGRWRERLAWSIAAVAVVVALAGWLVGRRSSSGNAATPTASMYRTSLLPPPGVAFSPHDFAISADGTRVAFVGIGPDGASTLWVRALDGPGAQPLNDTRGASYPFWAPDNRRLAFFAAGQLRSIDTTTGTTQSLASAPAGRGGSWGAGVIVFAPNVAGPLFSVAEGGGRAQPVTRVDAASGTAQRWPVVLPDQRRFLFFEERGGGDGGRPTGLYAGSLDDVGTTLVSSDVTGSMAVGNGHLVYLQDASLVAQPFDAATLTITGPAVHILDQEVGTDFVFGHGNFSISAGGVLVFRSLGDAMTEMVVHAADGTPLDRLPIAHARNLSLSPDGLRLAYGFDDPGARRSLRAYDLRRGIQMSLTDGGREDYPLWSRDGRALAYVVRDEDSYTVYEAPAGATGAPQRLLRRPARVVPTDYSPDGGSLAMMSFDRGAPEVLVYDRAADSVRTWGRGAEGQFSPDGKWLAWVILGEVFVQAADGSGSRLQISRAGGGQPRWSRDGTRLFYLAPDRKLMEVTVAARHGELTVGPPRPRFQTHVITPWFAYFQYDVAADASRFFVNSLKPEAPLTLVTGWPSLLRR